MSGYSLCDKRCVDHSTNKYIYIADINFGKKIFLLKMVARRIFCHTPENANLS